MANKSVATIASPEFINLQPLDVNPLMSSCEIKVLYVGENRNHSYISKKTAIEMSKTLRGAPIVGYFKKEKNDFVDHGNKIIIDDNGFNVECLTVPYGFVSPVAEVWFQKFNDEDEFGNIIEREYLMTTGFLWTGQFQEAQKVFEDANGRPQSMELDEETLDGKWARNNQTNIEYFIINDAIISKLCILGNDVEPCFEGANIKTPEVSTSFSLDDKLVESLAKMVKELEFALKGGQTVKENSQGKDFSLEEKNQEEILDNSNEEVVGENENSIEESSIETTFEEGSSSGEGNGESGSNSQDNGNGSSEEGNGESGSNNQDNGNEGDSNTTGDSGTGNNSNSENPESEEIEEEINNVLEEESIPSKTKKIKDEYILLKEYTALDNEFNILKNQYAELETKYNALLDFKNKIDSKEKDALINQFYMLSDEDKADVIKNKNNYSLEEIEAKLSVICVRKKVNFSKEEENKLSDKIVTYSLEQEESDVPAWITAIKNQRKDNI